MAIENPEVIDDQWVLNKLAERLAEIEASLAGVNKVEAVNTTGEDDEEQREEKNENEPLKELLQTEQGLIKARLDWVNAHGDACIAPNCPNKVPVGRRRNLGVTCPADMNNEEQILRERAMGL
jgi:hypothetical protein